MLDGGRTTDDRAVVVGSLVDEDMMNVYWVNLREKREAKCYTHK